MRKKILRNKSGFEKPESREEAIMQNILGASNVLEPSESNIEEILKSILYNTPYTKEAEFEIEKILLAIKNNGTYTGECESRDMKILFAILNESTYNEEPESRIEELFIKWLYQRSSIKVLEGVPPLTFTSHGLPLINYLIEGNTVQNGTPTPSNPVEVNGVGTLDSGQYKIPISSSATTTPVYLGKVESTRRIKKLVLTGEEANIFVYSGLGYIRLSDGLGKAIAPYSDKLLGTDVTANMPAFSIRQLPSDITPAILAIKADSNFPSNNAFKTWLAENQITVWYVLATPKTGIVNEPLMKIGDYADTLSKEQAGVEIPTNNGSTTLDVDTTVKPSNIYIEYK